MALPTSIQDLEKPKRYEEKLKGWIAYPGIYYNEHFHKMMDCETMPENCRLGFVKHEDEKSILSWCLPNHNDQEVFYQQYRELRREEFEAISAEVLRVYDERNLVRLFVQLCPCGNCAPLPMKYTLVYSEHDKELKTIFSSVPEFTRARRYTKKDIRTIRGDKALYLTWERMIPDLLYPDGLQTNVACNVWLDVPAFKKLGDTVAKDWEFRRIDCIWVDQHYPCPECDNSVKAKCLEDLTDG